MEKLYENKLDSLSGFQVLEPFDCHDNLACEHPGEILKLRTSSVYLDINGVETLPEPEDRDFLLHEALKMDRELFDEKWNEAVENKKEFGSQYEQEDRSYIDQILFDNTCVCGQWENNHTETECAEVMAGASKRYFARQGG